MPQRTLPCRLVPKGGNPCVPVMAQPATITRRTPGDHPPRRLSRQPAGRKRGHAFAQTHGGATGDVGAGRSDATGPAEF